MKLTLTEEDGTQQEIEIKKDTEFLIKDFTLRPVTTPASFKPGDIVALPNLVGDPAHLEWWHFQYADGYKGKRWSEILGNCPQRHRVVLVRH
ncbi:MAG: hypothetical protein WKF84_20400 [Pyrinomonadaceae bacterium]